MGNFVKESVFRLLLLIIGGLAITQKTSSATAGCPKDLPHTTEMKRFGDLCYQFVSEEKFWYDARRYCLQNGGRLVKIGDYETNSFIVRTLNSLWWRNNGVWIGLHDTYREMQFQWTGYRIYENEAAGSWTNWGRGHPGAFLHSLRDCVRMVREDGLWKWHETPCNSLQWHYRFICEYKAPANQPGVVLQLTLMEDKPVADNKMLETSTARSPGSTAAPASSPATSAAPTTTTTVLPTAWEQTSEIGLFESTRPQFDDVLNLTDEETDQAINSFTTPGVDNDESASFRAEFTEDEKDEAVVADGISFLDEESETLDDTKGSGVCWAIGLGFSLVVTCAVLLAACIVYRRRQQRRATGDTAVDDKEDKENKMAERNPSRAVGNIYVVTVPRSRPSTSDDVPEVEQDPVVTRRGANYNNDRPPTSDGETTPIGLHRANNHSTEDDCGDEAEPAAAAKYDCPGAAEIDDIYAEIAEEEEEEEEEKEEEKEEEEEGEAETVEHIYESLNDYCIA